MRYDRKSNQTTVDALIITQLTSQEPTVRGHVTCGPTSTRDRPVWIEAVSTRSWAVSLLEKNYEAKQATASSEF